MVVKYGPSVYISLISLTLYSIDTHFDASTTDIF